MVNTTDEAATVAATHAAPMQRVEIVSDRRRAHDPAFRALVVADSYVPGIRVRDLARKYRICTSLVYRWRRDQIAAAGTGSRLQLVPVHCVDEPRATRRRQGLSQPASASPPNVATKAASIEIEFPGGVRVRVDETVNQAALRRIVAVLRG